MEQGLHRGRPDGNAAETEQGLMSAGGLHTWAGA